MKILFENKQLNEGPGAGYTVSGTLTNVKVSAIKDIKEVDRTDLVEYEVELDATADFENVSANSYYYGGTIDSTPVSIIRAKVELEEGEVTNEDVKYALEGVKVKVNLGGGWSHSTFDGFIECDYMSFENAPYLTGVLFELTDERAITYLDKAVQNENTETQYGVVEGHWVEEAFDNVEEAIEFAKENGYESVQELYVLIDINGDEIDTEFGDIVWTADEIEEPLNEVTTSENREGEWFVGDSESGHIYYSEQDAKNAYDFLVNRGIKDAVMSKIEESVEKDSQKPLTEDFEEDERIQALAEYLGIDPSEISNSFDNEFETPEGDYLVVTEEEAEELAKEDIRNLFDDLGLESFTENFKDWIIMNALDNDWFEDAVREEFEYYVEDIESEASSMGYDNRLIEEMHDHQVLSDDDFEEDEDGMPNLRELKEGVDIDSLKEDFIDLLIENAGDPVEYCADNFGWDWVTQMATDHNLIDLDEVVEQCIYDDGIAHFIARYDGEEIELENGLFAYRTN